MFSVTMHSEDLYLEGLGSRRCRRCHVVPQKLLFQIWKSGQEAVEILIGCTWLALHHLFFGKGCSCFMLLTRLDQQVFNQDHRCCFKNFSLFPPKKKEDHIFNRWICFCPRFVAPPMSGIAPLRWQRINQRTAMGSKGCWR